MYEAKYMRYVTKSQSRFAERDEILEQASPLVPDAGGDMPSGIPLYYSSGKLYVDDRDVHSIVIGPTGCKKTRTTVFSTVSSIIEAGESAVINDPKGEIYRRTAARAEALGAKIFVLNFRNPERSHCWNPLSQAHRYYTEGKETEAIQSINDFVESVCAASEACTNDRYWVDTSRSFLNALALSLMASVPIDYFNITNLIQLCYEENRYGLKMLLAQMDPTSTAAFGLHTVLDLEAEKTRSCVYSSLLSMLTPFVQNTRLQEMLNDSTFDVSHFGHEQTIVYIIYPDEKTSLNFLVNAFFTQCYETLVTIAADSPMERLPVRVNFILDEFSNLPPINSFDNRISEARSRNIRYFLFIQSYDQLRQKYDKCAETILSNCGNWLCFSSKETEFLAKLSAVCGREVDYNGIEHDLISPFDMQHLVKTDEYTEVLIIRQGTYPYVAPLPDFDQVKLFRGYRQSSLAELNPPNTAKLISFKQWVAGIDSGKFKTPFPVSDRTTSRKPSARTRGSISA